MTNLDSVLKSRDITQLIKVCTVKVMAFPSSHKWLWELDCKEGGTPKNGCLQTVQFSSVQSLSHVWLFATPQTAARQPSLSITNSRSLLKTHVHWIGDVIQPSHPLSFPSPPVFNLSQHQGLFKWVSSSHQVAKILEFQLQHQSFQWIVMTDFL